MFAAMPDSDKLLLLMLELVTASVSMMCETVYWVVMDWMSGISLYGEDFLGFCKINQLSIINTWFQKKTHHYVSWYKM